MAAVSVALIMGGCATKKSEVSDDVVKVDQYKNLKLEEIENIAVTDDDVDQEVEYRVQMSAELKDVKRAAKKGDTVVCDYKGTIDGKEFEGNSEDDAQIEIGSEMMVGANGKYKGFEDQLIGHKAGDKFDIEVKFPEDYDSDGELSNKVAKFAIKVKKVQELEEKKLDDAWVKENSTTAKTVDEYKAEIRKELEDSNEKERKSRIREELYTELLKHVSWVKKPEDEIQAYVDEIKESTKQQVEEMGMTMDDYFEQSGYTEETYEEEMQKEAENTLLMEKAIALIAKTEKLTLSDEEFKESLPDLAEEYGYEDEKQFVEDNGEEAIRNYLLEEKVLDVLAKTAKFVKAEEGSTEDFSDEFNEDNESSSTLDEIDLEDMDFEME